MQMPKLIHPTLLLLILLTEMFRRFADFAPRGDLGQRLTPPTEVLSPG